MSRPLAALRIGLGASWMPATILLGTGAIVTGLFARPGDGAVPLLFALGIGGLLVGRMAGYLARGTRPLSRVETEAVSGAPSPRKSRVELVADLELGALVLLGAYAAFQATGGLHSPIHPLAYATVAFLITLHRRSVGLPLLAFAMLLEVALFAADARLAADAHLAAAPALTPLVSHLGFLLLFGVAHLLFFQSEFARQRRERRLRLAGEIAQMRTEAHDFRLISSQLSAESRTRSREEEEDIIAIGAVETIHQALFYNLDLLKRSLDLHTCVLFWLDDSGQQLRIKELVSDSDHISEESLSLNAGVLGAVAKDPAPVNLREPKREHLPYYDRPEPIGSFMGVRVMEGDRPDQPGHLRGILCADRLVRVDGGGKIVVPFERRDEQVLLGAARQILRAVQSERVFTAVERSKYEHERFYTASELLNRALTPDQVNETAFEAAKEIAEFDFAAITRYDRRSRKHTVVASQGEGTEEVEGLRYSDNAGLAAMAVKNKHHLPAAEDRRDRNVPVFTKKVKLKGMESLLVLPLIAADEAIGSFTLAARSAHRFPKDKREMLGVIANQVAVSLKNAEMYRAMEEMATTDGLTGLVNHRTFQERFADLLHRAERQNQPVTLLLTDIDHFKKVNDTHGHPVGDVVLRGVAQACQEQVRKIDLAARYGGEEFAIVLDGTDLEGARLLAERIRKEVAAQVFKSDKGEFSCTLSLGIAVYPADGRDPKALIGHSDQALYHAKHTGRNRSVSWSDIEPREPIAAIH